MGEDVNSVSPTLGFIIKTIDYEGSDFCLFGLGFANVWPKGINLTYVGWHYIASNTKTKALQGMLVVRRLSDHTGETTLKRQMP